MTSSRNKPETGWQGKAHIEDLNSEYNSLVFVIKQVLGRANVATVCSVVAVTGGGVAKACYVTLQPLINQVDGYGKAITPGLLHNVPCYRMQSGTSAIICDPQVGDIGVALFSDRDISTLKANYNNDKMSSVLESGVNPNTQRRFSVADGMYFGGLYNEVPTDYIQLLNDKVVINTTNEIELVATTKVNINSPWINLSSWVGLIAAFGNSSPPSGWLVCPTSETLVSTTTYADLFAAIGYTWGGSGASFGLPYFEDGYALLQGSVGVVSHGVVKDHTHPEMGWASISGYTGSGVGAPQTVNTGTPNSPEGGPDNLAAGRGVLICVKY